MREPPKGPSPLVIILSVIFGLIVLVCGFGLYATIRVAREVNHLSEQMINEAMDSINEPQVSFEVASVRWDHDVIAINLKASADLEAKGDSISIKSITLDDYFSDLKLPLKIGLKSGQSKVVEVRFPGYSGRGGKNAKLKMTFGKLNESTSYEPHVALPLRKK